MWAAAEHSKASPLLARHDDWWELANMATGIVPLELSRLLDTVVKVCDVANEENMLSGDIGWYSTGDLTGCRLFPFQGSRTDFHL